MDCSGSEHGLGAAEYPDQFADAFAYLFQADLPRKGAQGALPQHRSAALRLKDPAHLQHCVIPSEDCGNHLFLRLFS